MIAALAFAIALAAAPTAPDVVFQKLSTPDGAGAPIEVGVWRPAGGSPNQNRRLIVMSHGAGGDFRGHEDTARALAQAGFVVASLTHTGDNWRDHSRAADVAERPRQLHVLIDYMLKDWEGHSALDPDRVGAFGFSSGGFTVLTTAGGEPDLSRMTQHCRDHPGFYDCRLVAGARPMSLPSGWVHDPRIKAVVAAAPALGFTFEGEGLAKVRQPVQLWRAGQDQILPSPFYAEAVREALPKPPEYHVVDGARHFDFLAPCGERLAAAAPEICAPTPGFDRAAFHEIFNREVVRFFNSEL